MKKRFDLKVRFEAAAEEHSEALRGFGFDVKKSCVPGFVKAYGVVDFVASNVADFQELAGDVSDKIPGATLVVTWHGALEIDAGSYLYLIRKAQQEETKSV